MPVRRQKLLCIGNGGIIRRHDLLWSHDSVGSFLRGLAAHADVSYCAWIDTVDDPLSQTPLENIPGVRVFGLPPFQGRPIQKFSNGSRSLAMLVREISTATFVYLYWPGRLSSIVARLCRLLRKPYGIYFRGEQIVSDTTFGLTFEKAEFVLSTGESLCAIAKRYCKDAETVTPMTPVRPEHLHAPRIQRSGPWRLLYVGRLEERKGVFDLISAIAYLEQSGMEFNLTLVGHCYDKQGLMARIPAASQERVRLLDAVPNFEQLASLYVESDIFVFPSHDEGFPRVLYEAMTFGLPIVTTFVGSISSLMRDGINCLQIRAKNPKDIADKIEQLIENPDLRLAVAIASHKKITDLMKTWRRSHADQIAERL